MPALSGGGSGGGPGESGQGPRVLLHIGPPKTGTTYLQSALWVNRAALRRAGVLLPGKSRTDHFKAAKDLRRFKRRAKALREHGPWSQLAAQARDWPGWSVISCEWLAFSDEQQTARALESFGDAEVHVAVTLRDLGRVVPAVWQEQVKNRKSFTMAEFLNELEHPDDFDYGRLFWSVHDTRQLLGRWSQLPAERIHIVTLPRDGAPPDELWRRFRSLFVTAPDDTFDLSQIRANPGLDPASAEMLRRVNVELAGRVRKRAHGPLVKDLLHEELTRQPSSSKVRLPPSSIEFIADRSKQIVAWLAESGHPVAGDLADLEVRFSDGPTALPEESPEDAVAQAAVRSMAALLVTMQADGTHRRKVWRAIDRPAESPPRRAAALARRAAGKVRRAVAKG